MVVKPDGSFITARTHPQLQQVVATPSRAVCSCAVRALTPHPARAGVFPHASGHRVWSDSFSALQTQPQADQWLSQVAGSRFSCSGSVKSPPAFGKTGTGSAFADGYPLLLISQASLEDLNLRSDALHQMSQFRTNLVASGTLPFEEDGWKRIRIGEVEFLVAKPCSRCIMTTVEPGTDRFNALKEPLATLTRYRRGEDGEVSSARTWWPSARAGLRQTARSRYWSAPAPLSTPTPPRKTGAGVRGPRAVGAGSGDLLVRGGRWRALPDYLPGQHLPISLDIGLGLRRERLQRRYTLSSTPGGPSVTASASRRWGRSHLPLAAPAVATR